MLYGYVGYIYICICKAIMGIMQSMHTRFQCDLYVGRLEVEKTKQHQMQADVYRDKQVTLWMGTWKLPYSLELGVSS